MGAPVAGTVHDAPAVAPVGSPVIAGTVRARRRHPGDVVRLTVGIVVLLLAVLAVQKDRLSVFERDVFRLVNNLPGQFSVLLLIVMQGGNMVAGPVVAAASGIARRWRLSAELTAAGPAAWVVAKVVKQIVERPRPAAFLDGLVRHEGGQGLGFVSGHTAVATALVTVAAPYLPRRWARAAWALAWSVGLARVYMGAHLPLDIVGGAALGWSIGAGIHVAFGAPHRSVSATSVLHWLRRTGLPVTSVMAAGGRARGSFPFLATAGGSHHSLFVKVLDPDARDHDLSFRFARFLAIRDVRDEVALSEPKAQAEHEAAMAMLAREGGCRTPAVHRVQAAGGRVWLVQDFVPGQSLDGSASIDPRVLTEIWHQVVLLHRADLAHRDLVASNIVVDPAGQPWLVDFAHAGSGPSRQAQDNDVAELLASTACLIGVGPEVAVDAAAAVLAPEVLGRALPELQPLALTAATRRDLRNRPGVLDALRAAVAARSSIVVPAAPSVAVASWPKAALPVVLGTAGVGTLAALTGSGALGDAFAGAGRRWIGLAAVFAGMSVAGSAAALVGAAGRRLGLGRTSLLRIVAAATSAIRRGGEAHVMARYLERAGVAEPEAHAAIARFRIARWVAASAVLVLAGIGGVVEAGEWQWPPDAVAGLGLAAALLCAAAVIRRGRTAKPSPGALRGGAREATLVVVVASAGLAVLAEGATLAAAAAGFGGGVSIPLLMAIAVVGARLTESDRLGGAPGAGELLLAFALAAAGMSLPAAAATSLVSRALSYWAPLLAGTAGARVLERRFVL